MFGVCLRLWQMGENGEEVSLLLPDNVSVHDFLRAVLASLTRWIDQMKFVGLKFYVSNLKKTKN